MTEYLKDVKERASDTGSAVNDLIGQLANGLYYVLPNLRSFDLRTQILYLQPNDPPVDVQIPNLIALGLVYALVGYALAFLFFHRREL